MRRLFNLNVLAVTAVFAAIILYLSLFPFRFFTPEAGPGPIRTMIDAWGRRFRPDDFLENIVLYAPLGFLGVLAFRDRIGPVWRAGFVVLAGSLLSFAIEYAQYFDVARYPNTRDIFANGLGTLIGTIAAVRLAADLRWRIVSGQLHAKLFPGMVVAAWAGYRLFPFVPNFRLDRTSNAFRSVFLTPGLTGYDLVRSAISWLAVCALLEAAAGKNRSLRLFPVFTLGMIFARMAIVGTRLSIGEIAGAATGFGLWLALIRSGERFRAGIIALLLGILVLGWRFQPSQFTGSAGEYDWIPFLSMMRGSLFVNVQALFEKLFYYGALLWLVTAAGGRLRTAAISLALALLASDLAGAFLLGRPAETTDAFMMVAVAAMIALMNPQNR